MNKPYAYYRTYLKAGCTDNSTYTHAEIDAMNDEQAESAFQFENSLMEKEFRQYIESCNKE